MYQLPVEITSEAITEQLEKVANVVSGLHDETLFTPNPVFNRIHNGNKTFNKKLEAWNNVPDQIWVTGVNNFILAMHLDRAKTMIEVNHMGDINQTDLEKFFEIDTENK